MVRRSTLTLCLSQQQVNTLQTRHSEKAVVVRHFPLGVVESCCLTQCLSECRPGKQ